MSAPRISVVIPVFDMAHCLPDAVSSIRRQSRAVDEILIVDNASRDDSAAVARALAAADPRIQVLREPEPGAARARNRGIAAATGEIIAFLDADDLWPQDKIERQMARLMADPAIDVVSGLATFAERLDAERLAADISGRHLTYFHIVFGAALYRRHVFDRLGPIDPGMIYAEDGDFFLRLLEAGMRVAVMRSVTVLIRRDGTSMTATAHEEQKRFLARVVAKSLARRRRGDGSVAAAPSFQLLFDPA